MSFIGTLPGKVSHVRNLCSPVRPVGQNRRTILLFPLIFLDRKHSCSCFSKTNRDISVFLAMCAEDDFVSVF
jgi:hypothetical protein